MAAPASIATSPRPSSRAGSALGGARPLRHGPGRRLAAQVLPADDVPVPVGQPAHRALVRKTPTDAIARFHRMHGENVFLPIGFDSFGLPAENAAIKNKIHPREWTLKNIDNMRRQLRSMGATFDWKSEVVTCDPDYYRWNQWIFLRFLEAGLAYRAKSPVDWCPNDGTLAREQVEGTDRHCWRCGARVEKRDLEQWYLRTPSTPTSCSTSPASNGPSRSASCRPTGSAGRRAPRSSSRPRPTTTSRRRRAARLHDPTGHAVRRHVHGPVARTRAGAQADPPGRKAEVEAYVAAAGRETEIERMSTEREKTGVFTGSYAINPVNGERIPIWIADYVLAGYGTGAIMAVPAHDERDFAFARSSACRSGASSPARRFRTPTSPRRWSGLHRPRRRRSAGQLRAAQRQAGEGGLRRHRRHAREGGQRARPRSTTGCATG
jgi:leucyl-tRNA synthetase